MDILKIKEYIEAQFVDDYEEIHKFMLDVNETLTKIKIDGIYNSYNSFCLDIEKSVIETVKENNIIELTPNIIVIALNNMVKHKILNDINYEQKINEYFESPNSIIDDINKLRFK